MDGSNVTYGTLSRKEAAYMGYTIGFSVLVLLGVIYISYRCNREKRRTTTMSTTTTTTMTMTTITGDVSSVTIPRGISEAILLTYPSPLYSQVMKHKGNDSVASGCSICLVDYKETDMLRLLPECGHVFHLQCVDPWLKLHPTCPICRKFPVSTPLAQVVSLARQ